MVDAVETPYQSLYRRYRPQRFAEMVGQDHVVRALSNAVRDRRVAHAYLFSGPRGTGKTSAARILAKALNCEHPVDGEPDGTCDSCISIQQGASLDVHELDAASNSGVDAMRDLVSRAALGTPGRWKVYIIDEVHMLSTAASNALLKTLEEPPGHVIFVLATTDPQKILPTIRSRTQHFEFRLLSAELLGSLVSKINNEADLHVPPEALALVVRRGRGSARDALSVLDQVAAAGAVDDEHEVIDELTEALCERDTGRALVAIAEGILAGRDPQRLAIDLLEYLRNGFLALMARGLVCLPDNAVDHIERQARRLGAPGLVRAMEVVGTALGDMRDAPEPRVTLEVALVRITKAELDTDPAALLERIDRLERSVASTGPPDSTPTVSPPTVSPTPPPASSPSPALTNSRPTLGGLRRRPPPAADTAAPTSRPGRIDQPLVSESEIAPPVHDQSAAALPTRDELVEAWGDHILEALPTRVRSRFRLGRFIDVKADGDLKAGKAVFALPNAFSRDRCEEVRIEAESALRSHFGLVVPLDLVVEGDLSTRQQTPPPQVDHGFDDEVNDIDEIHDINDVGKTVQSVASKVASPEERLLQIFPGAEEMR